MNKRSRIIIGLAALALGLMYLFPLWKISLDAPQYPEGIGLEIWIDTVKGQKPHDLANVNNLNHYIGMKRIEPDSIPELKMMPWIIGFMIVTGLLTAMVGKRWMLYLWLGVLVMISVVGLVDFYLWEYDYGHNLDQETAIIKIPGMSYQPPLLGSKQLLNFVATSWPALGGIVALLVMGVGAGVAWNELRTGSRGEQAAIGKARLRYGVITMLALLGMGCTPAPRPLKAGVDRCEHCLMGLSDTRFGGELVMPTGKVHVFDAIECMTAFLHENEVAPHSIWVVDYTNPGTLIPAEPAAFAQGAHFHSPMGGNLAGFSRIGDLEDTLDSSLLTWQEVLELSEALQTMR